MAVIIGALSRRDVLTMSTLSGVGALCGVRRAVAAAPQPEMLILDAQVHAYERNYPGRPWKAFLEGPPELTGDELVTAMNAVGVDGTVLVSPWTSYRYDASYALSVYAKHPTRFALVKPVDSSDPAVADTINDWAATKGAVGIRILLLPGASPDDPADPGVNRALAAAARHSLPVNVGCLPVQLPQVKELAKRNPNTMMVIDHLAMDQPMYLPVPPDTLKAQFERGWAHMPELLALAAHPNIRLKLTGVCTLSAESFPYKDIWDPLSRIFDAFGVNRCMWGSDWTPRWKRVTYGHAVDAFLVTNRLSDSDRRTLMSGTLQEVYKWSPTKA